MKQKYLLLSMIPFVFLLLFTITSLALIPGDFGSANNGPPDGCVDFEDLMIFALAYGSTPSDSNWNPSCDIAGPGGSLTPDGVIDFEDLMVFAMHYGEGCGCTLPLSPTLSDPGGTLTSPATYNVDWSSVTEATSYVLQEATSSNFSSGLQEYTTTGTSRSFSHTVTTTTTYYYRVAAVNDCGQSGWSNVEDIEIEGIPSGGTKWTIMVYMDGDNDLDDCAWDDLSELESVSSTDEIKIVTQLDAYYSCSGTFRYYITGATPGASYPLYPDDIVQTLPEQNMADPATLTSFVNWATTNYPAEKYLLVLWNHGAGWREYNIPTKGIIVDETSGDFMTMAELVQGLEGINEVIDIIGFDACLMQMAEVAYEINGLTNVPNYMVGSEASEWGDGWPYDDILAHLLANPEITDTVLCETIVDDFINYCGSVGTLSALDFSAGTYDTYQTLNSFAVALMASSYQNEITAARSSAQSYSYSIGYRCKDIYDFAERIKNSVPDCQSEAQAVMNQVNDLVLFEAHTGSGVANSHGLSIYLPDNASEYDNDYNDLQFAVDTQWDEFLKSGQNKVTGVSAIAITSTLPDMSKLKEKMNQLKSEENVSSYYMLNEIEPLNKGIVEKLIEIEWRAYPEATGYRIYKSTNGSTYSLIGDWQPPTGYDWYGWWDYDVVEGNTYFYCVVAYGSFGETSPSQETLTIDTWLPSCSLISPPNGSVITDPTPTFNWNPVGVSSFPYGSIMEGESDLWVYDDTVGSTSWWLLFNNMTVSTVTYNQDGQATSLINGHNYEWNSWAYGYDGDSNLIAMSWSEDWGFDYSVQTSSVYRGFLVGVGDYQYFPDAHGNVDLQAPPFDVDRMYDTLTHSGSGFSLINELIDLQATKEDILNGIASAFAEADEDDVSYFYFSGHGMNYNGVSYLCPTDISYYSSLNSYISTNELETALSAIPGTKVVILDCCYSGGFIGKQIEEEKIFSNAQEFNNNVINVFLSRDLTSSQYKVLTSCLSSQVCWELIPSEGDPFGLFSGVLCEGCGYNYYTHPYFADGNGNSEITLHEAYTYTDEQVTIITTQLNDLYGWNIDQDTQVYPLNSNFVIIEE
jgi:hypothetical protein